MLIARVPSGDNWVSGSSRCPTCHHDIAWYDNVPVLAWLWLRGRCRHCRERISARYPAVELIVASLIVLAYLRFDVSIVTLTLMYLAVVTVALVFIDIDVQRLPDALVLPSFPIVAALLAADAAVAGEWWPLARGGIGLIALGAFYGIPWLVYPAGMGRGDVKVAALLGMVAGYLGWPHLAVGGLLGPLIGGLVVAVGMAMRKIGRRSRVPYGPALIAAAWVGFLAAPEISDKYLNLIG